MFEGTFRSIVEYSISMLLTIEERADRDDLYQIQSNIHLENVQSINSN